MLTVFTDNAKVGLRGLNMENFLIFVTEEKGSGTDGTEVQENYIIWPPEPSTKSRVIDALKPSVIFTAVDALQHLYIHCAVFSTK